MTIDKAIYGLHSSGARYHEQFTKTMRDMGFTPSPANPDVLMHDASDVYKYLVVYVDDLIAIMKDPKACFDELQQSPHNYTLKGLTESHYHLGADYFRDKDGTLCFGTQTYVKPTLNPSTGSCPIKKSHLSRRTTIPNLTPPIFALLMTLPSSTPLLGPVNG